MASKLFGTCSELCKLPFAPGISFEHCDSLDDKNLNHFRFHDQTRFVVVNINSDGDCKRISSHIDFNTVQQWDPNSCRILLIETCRLYDKNSANDHRPQKIGADVGGGDDFGLCVVVEAYCRRRRIITLYNYKLNTDLIVSSLDLDFVPVCSVVVKDARTKNKCSGLADYDCVILLGGEMGQLCLINIDWSSNRCALLEEPVKCSRIYNFESLYTLERLIPFCFDILDYLKKEDEFHWSTQSNRMIFSLSNVFVTSLSLIGSASSLAVGFNVGCFMLISVDDFKPTFYSEVQPSKGHVTRFTYQEPENDPRATMYLWVVRELHGTAQAEMYQMCFAEKNLHKYKKLEFCVCRFTFTIDNCSKLLSAKNFELPSLCPDSTDLDEGLPEVDTGLVYISWVARESKYVEGRLRGALFDLNGWYYAQMPRKFDLDPEHNKCYEGPKNRRYVDFLVVHDYGTVPDNEDNSALIVKTLADTVERCLLEQSETFASTVGFRSLLVTKKFVYTLQICHKKRQALNALQDDRLTWDGNDNFSEIVDILSGASLFDYGKNKQMSLTQVKSQIFDLMLDDENFEFLSKMSLGVGGQGDLAFDQWLWQTSIDFKEAFDDYVIATLQSNVASDYDGVHEFRRKALTLTVLYQSWLDNCRLSRIVDSFEERDALVREAELKTDAFLLIRNYVNITAYFFNERLRPLVSAVDRHIKHVRLNGKNTESLKILWNRIGDPAASDSPESFFHVLNVYLRPEINRFGANFIVYYSFLAVDRRVHQSDDYRPFESSLKIYRRDMTSQLGSSFVPTVDCVFNWEHDSELMALDIVGQKSRDLDVVLELCGLERLSRHFRTNSPELLPPIEIIRDMYHYKDDFDSFVPNDDDSAIVPSDSGSRRDLSLPRLFRRKNLHKRFDVSNPPRLLKSVIKLEAQRSRLGRQPSTPVFLKKAHQARKQARNANERRWKEEPPLKRTRSEKEDDTDTSMASSVFFYDVEHSIKRMDELAKEESVQKLLWSPLLKRENFAQRLSLLQSSGRHGAAALDKRPRKSILIDSLSSAKKSTPIDHGDRAFVKKFRFDVEHSPSLSPARDEQFLGEETSIDRSFDKTALTLLKPPHFIERTSEPALTAENVSSSSSSSSNDEDGDEDYYRPTFSPPKFVPSPEAKIDRPQTTATVDQLMIGFCEPFKRSPLKSFDEQLERSGSKSPREKSPEKDTRSKYLSTFENKAVDIVTSFSVRAKRIVSEEKNKILNAKSLPTSGGDTSARSTYGSRTSLLASTSSTVLSPIIENECYFSAKRRENTPDDREKMDANKMAVTLVSDEKIIVKDQPSPVRVETGQNILPVSEKSISTRVEHASSFTTPTRPRKRRVTDVPAPVDKNVGTTPSLHAASPATTGKAKSKNKKDSETSMGPSFIFSPPNVVSTPRRSVRIQSRQACSGSQSTLDSVTQAENLPTTSAITTHSPPPSRPGSSVTRATRRRRNSSESSLNSTTGAVIGSFIFSPPNPIRIIETRSSSRKLPEHKSKAASLATQSQPPRKLRSERASLSQGTSTTPFAEKLRRRAVTRHSAAILRSRQSVYATRSQDGKNE